MQDKQLLATTISQQTTFMYIVNEQLPHMHINHHKQLYLSFKMSFLCGSIKATPRCCDAHLVSNQYIGLSIMDTSQHFQGDDGQRDSSLLGLKDQNLLWQVRPISMSESFSLSCTCTRKRVEGVWEEWRGEREGHRLTVHFQKQPEIL